MHPLTCHQDLLHPFCLTFHPCSSFGAIVVTRKATCCPATSGFDCSISLTYSGTKNSATKKGWNTEGASGDFQAEKETIATSKPGSCSAVSSVESVPQAAEQKRVENEGVDAKQESELWLWRRRTRTNLWGSRQSGDFSRLPLSPICLCMYIYFYFYIIVYCIVATIMHKW